jgi:amino acid transporter
MTDLSNKIIQGTKCYVTENWGSPFIAAFMLFLIGAGISLSLDLFDFANSLSVYAFCALVIGVILQLVCFLKYRKESTMTEAVQ